MGHRRILPLESEWGVLVTVSGVLLGAAFLFAFFRAVQLNWPESYFGIGELAAYAISASPWRYVAFRFGPVLVTAIFVAVSVERAGGDGSMGAIATAGLHAGLTSGWGLLQAVRWPKSIRRRRRPILLVRLVVLIGVVGIGYLAAAFSGFAAPLVPPLSDLSATLWTGLIAGVLGAFIVRISRGHPVHEHEMIDRSQREIPKSLWNLAARLAIENEADPDLARAIMVVENLQRPSWFRRVERLKGVVSPSGTYGIMQVLSDKPINDEESIEKVIIERLRDVNVRSAVGWVDSDLLHAFAQTYNSSSDFLALLEVAYRAVRPETHQMRTSGSGHDHRPLIEVEVIERLDGHIRLEGTALVPSGILTISEDDGSVEYRKSEARVLAVGSRGFWRALLTPTSEVSRLVISSYWSTNISTDGEIIIDMSSPANE